MTTCFYLHAVKTRNDCHQGKMTLVTYHLSKSCEVIQLVIKQEADIIQDRLAITALVF